MVPAAESLEPVRQAVRAGVKGVWFYRAIGQGAVSPGRSNWPERRCDVVAGECPFCFCLRVEPLILHRVWKRLTGSLPR